ncbi:MAG: sugar phosphate isomerase/epimerase [Oscillospiraceae bacterium]|nr:sugar phosphate isomerase/epimerase [Oscillospiraceae bacterium]
MNTGIFLWFGYDVPAKDRLKTIAEAGFQNICIWWGDQYKNAAGPKEEIPDLARSYGLQVENIHTDYESTHLIWTDKLGWEDVVKRYLKNVDDCYNNEIETMVLHLTDRGNQPEPNDLGVDRLKRIVDLAERRGVNIAIENLRKSEYLSFVFDKINSNKLKFCYDSGHENIFSKNGYLLDKFGNKLICLHLHDNDGTSDQHRIPGEGTIDWSNICKKLRDNDYKGSITLEVTNEFSDKYKFYSYDKFLFEAFKKASDIYNGVHK